MRTSSCRTACTETARADPRPRRSRVPPGRTSPSRSASSGATRPAPMKRSCSPGCSSKMFLSCRTSARRARILLAHRLRDMRSRRCARNAARHDRIHQSSDVRTTSVQPQHVLLQPGKLRQPEREAGVVADEAEVAQMIGDALALEQQRAQPARALGGVKRGGALGGHRIGPGIGDGRIAAHAPRQPRAVQQAACDSKRFSMPLCL